MSISKPASSGFGATSKWSSPVSFNRGGTTQNKPALTNSEFLRQSCAKMNIAIGPRTHENCPHGVIQELYSPNDSAALEQAIAAGYRQVYGNAHVMDFERSVELEASSATAT